MIYVVVWLWVTCAVFLIVAVAALPGLACFVGLYVPS